MALRWSGMKISWKSKKAYALYAPVTPQNSAAEMLCFVLTIATILDSLEPYYVINVMLELGC